MLKLRSIRVHTLLVLAMQANASELVANQNGGMQDSMDQSSKGHML